jgi:tripartite ATP-independent transporter DctM subunit
VTVMGDYLIGEILGGLMFIAALALIFTGYPVAFALGGVALIFGALGLALGEFSFAFIGAMPQRVFGIMSNYTLLAVPFFIFMGVILERARLAEDLLETMGMLFGAMRGGLAIAVVFVGALLAATTGVVGATVVAMGLISLPIMLRYGYDKSLATGVIASSGTLGQIIPPSVILVVLGDQLGISVGDLFLGALIPGVALAGMYMLYVAVFSFFRPERAPALPKEVRTLSPGQLLWRVIRVMIPPLVLIFSVLGSIFFGLATPTEAGAVGAVGALFLALVNRRLSLKTLTGAMDYTAKLTAMVIFILIGATAFALIFRGLGGDFLVRDILTGLPGGELGFLVFSMLLIFILGFFIDFFEIVFIVVPLLLPAAHVLGIDLLWFGVLIGLNLQTSFLTPPFGFALFYLRSVTPKGIRTTDIYRGVIPFIVIQLLALLLIVLFPQLVSWLPSLRHF